MSAEWRDRISDDNLSRPKLRVSGLPVDAVLDALAEGGREQLREAQPSLSNEDVRACLAYAAEKVRTEIVRRIIREAEADSAAGHVTPDEDLDAIFGPLDEDDE